MKTFTPEESLRIVKEMRERLGYSWVKDLYLIEDCGISVVRNYDVDELNDKWDLGAILEMETVQLD